MKSLCMIAPKGLPLPNIKGGAIETLITSIIKENERYNKLNLTVVSIYDSDAKDESLKYKNTKFIYINEKSINYIVNSVIAHCSKIFNRSMNTYNRCVLKKIKKKKFDYIIVEDGAYQLFQEYLRYFNSQQMVLHLHHVDYSSLSTDRVFSKFIGVSNYVIEKFKTHSKIKDYYLLKNSINISNFNKKINEAEKNILLKKYHFSTSDYIVLYCGRLVKEKGILELIKAVNSLNKKNIKLLIVGSINFANGGEDEYTRKLRIEAEKNSNTVFAGYVDNAELYKYYQLSNVLVVPTICEEAAGIVCIEGMISKTLIITTGSGGIKEYVNDYAIFVNNDENLINNLKEKILLTYNNRNIIDLNKAYEHAKQFSNENYYKNLINLLEEDFNEKR